MEADSRVLSKVGLSTGILKATSSTLQIDYIIGWYV
jgi:hypothetical protein